MAFLGNALLRLGVDRKGLDEGLKGAEKRTEQFGKKAEKSTGKASKGFSKIKSSIVGSSAQVPVFGGLISKVLGAAAAGPIGLATAGLVAMGAAVAAGVTKVANLEKELRPMIARAGIGGEQLQVLAESAKRAGSEDGLEGVTDSSQELQLRLAELVQDGTGPAGAAFDKLGLSGQDLIDKSPEEAFLATVTALQGVTSAADKKFLADELMGGSSEKLSGILNLTSAEFAALTENVRENADIVSNEGLESGRQFNGLMTEMKDVMGKAMTTIGEAFLPVILDLVDAFRDIYPEIKPLVDMIGNTLKTAFQVLASLLKIVAAVLRGDFAGAWREVKLLVLGVVESIIANVESLIEFLPDKFVPDSWEQGVKDARAAINAEMDSMKEKVEEAVGDTADAVADATTASIRSWTAEQEAAEERAKNLGKVEKEITKTLAGEAEKRLEELRKFWEDMAEAQAKYRSEQRTADLDHYDATNTEYKLALASLSTMSAEHLAALQAGNDDASDHELAMQIIANRRYADTQKVADDAAVLAAEAVAADALAADIAHRADLVAALDTHIDIVKANIEIAGTDEKLALIGQLEDLKAQRDAAYAAAAQDRMAAKQAEIDAIDAQIKTAQGAELAGLKAHQALLLAQYGALVAGINAEIAKVKTVPGGGGGGGGGGAPPRGRHTAAEAAEMIAQWLEDNPKPTDVPFAEFIARPEIARLRYDHLSEDEREERLRRRWRAWNTSAQRNWQANYRDYQNVVNANIIPGSADGGIFLPRPGGHLVNLAEGGEPEAVLNPGQLAAIMGIDGSGDREITVVNRITIGDYTLADLVTRGRSEAEREGIWD